MARTARRPLVVTADTELLDDLLHLAAAARVEFDVSADLAAARQRFALAPLVLIGLDVTHAGLAGPFDHRELVLVGRSDGGTEPSRQMNARLGAAHIAMLPADEPWLVSRFVDLASRPVHLGPLRDQGADT